MTALGSHLPGFSVLDVELVGEPDALIVGPASRIFEDGETPGSH
ncbi:hypothetical protein [Paenarthrobacter sp. NPDC058040]